jgi:predicted cupin superfamily sugar epimerase
VKYAPYIFCFVLFVGLTASAQDGRKTMVTAKEIIEKLDLAPLPEEGGYYKQTYCGKIKLPANELGITGEGVRTVGTAIYYLVVPSSFSALHRLKSDEIFHFYAGNAVEMIQIDPNGELRRYTIGSDIMAGQVPQVVVPAGSWQGLRLKSGGAWALLGTTMSPGFEFEDFELGERQRMFDEFPQLRNEIMNYSRAENESTH